jgi:preprotein translocase subunit YajC
MPPLISSLFAQISSQASSTAGTDASAQQGAPSSLYFLYIPLFAATIYFAMIRPQAQARKKQEETLKSARTGDKVVTSSGIHGVITNVKETTVIVRVADNVKLEIEKTHLDKITRPDSDADKVTPVKA